MYKDILLQSGLSKDEAAVYEALLVAGPQGAGSLLARVHIKRGLLYKVLDRLSSRGLVVERKKEGRTIFSPQPPDVLAKLAEDNEVVAKSARAAIAAALPELKAKYILSTERPVIQFFEGLDGLKKIYEDSLASGAKDFYFIRPVKTSVSYERAYGRWFKSYRERRAAAGITTHGMTPDDADTNHDPAVDASWKLVRTWLRPQDYGAPIEMNIYGDKLAILSYGKEIFGIVIENAPLAQAFRDLFRLADRGAKTIDIVHRHKNTATPQ